MTAHSSDPHPRTRRARRKRDQRGAALALVALTLLVILGSAGLAIDLGRGYVGQLRLSRAVDAGALAAARVLRSGQEVAREEAEAVARANGVATGVGSIATALAFGTNDRGENTVVFSASQTLPTVFMRVLGIPIMNLSAEAEAAVPPLDVVVVLDTSGSLGQAGAWGALQDAARAFVALFSDQIDQIGIVSFQLSAHNVFNLRHNFSIPVQQAINNMSSAGDTNVQDGLMRARAQITGPWARPSAAKVVVFFTDGRPTALRGSFGGQDRIMAVYGNTDQFVRGYFNNPNGLPPGLVAYPGGGGNPPGNWPGGCRNNASCFGLNAAAVRNLAAQRGLEAAGDVREEGVLLYVIGLGNPTADPYLVPDQDYLRELANEGGIANPAQPQGQMYFAPTSDELVSVFEQVAQDLVVRLAR